MKKSEKKLTLFSCVWKMFAWYFSVCVFWTCLFCIPFNFQIFIRALDVLCAFGNYAGIDEITRIQLLVESAIIVYVFYKMVYSIINLYGVILNIWRINNTNKLLTSIGCSFGVDGPQGVGKTRLLVYMLLLISEDKIREMKIKYYVDCPVRNDIENDARNGNPWAWVRFKSRENAITYYSTHADKIPGAYTWKININFDGKTPYELKRKHFTMEEQIFEGNTKLLSEADNFFPNTLRKKKKDDEDELKANKIDEYVGLDRQYTNGTLLSDTHANGSIYKSIRDCQQLVFHLTKSEYRMTPKILKRIYERLKNKVEKRGIKTSKGLRRRYKRVEMLMKCCAVTRLYYIDSRTIDGKTTTGNESFLVLPNQVPYIYDDRVLQTEYPHAPKIT